jgi:hypothetical protein
MSELNSTANTPSAIPKFWSVSPQSDKLVWNSPIWLILLCSAIAHAAFWLLLPNPIRQNSDVSNAQISIIPVVTIPPELLPKSTKPRSSQQLPPLNLNQINLPSITQPNYSPDSIRLPINNPPPPLLSVVPQNLPKTSNLRTVPNSSNLNPNLAISTKQSNLNFSVEKSNIRPEITITPTKPLPTKPIDNSANNSSSNLIINNNISSNPDPNPVINNTTPNKAQPNSNINPTASGYSYKASDLVTATKKANNLNSNEIRKEPKPVVNNIVVLRQIASPDTPIPADQVEPVDWIPINPQSLVGISGSVTFALVVTPEGKVEQETVVESTNIKLEQLAREAIKGYYNKFKPVEAGKYRNVRIYYKAP